MIRTTLYSPSPSDISARRGLGKGALLVSILAIVFCGTFPFDLAFEATSAIQQIRDKFFPIIDFHDVAGDRKENIVFFIPLGIAIALLMPSRTRWYVRVLLVPVATLIGTFFSGAIEIMQAFIGSRDSSMTDIFNNTIGCAVGFIFFAFLGDQLLRPVLWAIRLARPYVGLRVLSAATVAVALIGIGSPLLTIGFGSLSRWDNSYSLVIGRELVPVLFEKTYSWGFPRARPWTGVISDIAIADRSVSDSEATRLYTGGTPAEVLGQSLVGEYNLTGPGPYADTQHVLPSLHWEGQPRERAARGIYISDAHWLLSDGAIAPAMTRIASSDAFTLLLRITPPATRLFQEGPARILNITDGKTGVNLMVGHRDHDLVIRSRARIFARSGLAPEVVLQGVFDMPGTKTILISYDPWRLRAWCNDAATPREVRITPEMTILWHLYPRPMWWFPLGTLSVDVYAIAYRVLLFATLGVMGATTMRHTNLTIANRFLALAVLMLLADVILECSVAMISPYAFRPVAPPTALTAAAIGVALVRQRHHSSPSADGTDASPVAS